VIHPIKHITVLCLAVVSAVLMSAQHSDTVLVKQEESGEVFTIVESLPEYPGGQRAMTDFILKNLTYPTAAIAAGIEGKVYVQFIIEKDGTVSNVEAKNKLDGGCSEEAVRVVKIMPKWKPGMQNGKPVRVVMNLPFNFKYR
jgi:periplasmic protein TonB